MKKLVLLAMSAMLIAFTGCNQNEPLPDADKDVTNVTPKIDPNQSTTVTVYMYSSNSNDNYAVLDSICIYNDKEVKVGVGGYIGDYLVPYNGSIQLIYHGEDSGTKSKSQTDRYKVGTAKQMYIEIYASYYYENSWALGSAVTDGKN